MRDYVETLGVQIREGAQGCGVSLKDHGGALFPEIETPELRSRLNEAMNIAVAHYAGCSKRAGIEFSQLQLMEVSFRVVLYILLHRHIDTRASRQPPNLHIEISDLRSSSAKTRCWVYCESKFPNDYRERLAALLEMNLPQFRQYELEHRPEMVDLGLLREPPRPGGV